MMASFLPVRERVVTNDDIGMQSRFNSNAATNQDAAKLLLQVRMIATHEVVRGDAFATPVTPTHSPKRTVSIRDVPTLHNLDSPAREPRQSIKNADDASTDIRFRAISFDLQDDAPKQEADHCKYHVSVSPLDGFRLDSPVTTTVKQDHAVACLERDDGAFMPEQTSAYSQASGQQEAAASTTTTKKFVGDSLPEGVRLNGVLRKKFSWKSFPELEAYLVDHRPRYLSCSNSLNYTKAQKLYNNELTQGLLDLAVKEGYIFDGFTFAAVRDRIRCFYKSFVQANKKKKRLKQRARSSSM